MFRSKQRLEGARIGHVPKRPGVYIIYRGNDPFYIGRSLVDVHRRLLAHAMKRGSRKVREALERGDSLHFEWEEILSAHQAEAELIRALGTINVGNLRRETDPADW